MTEHIESGGDSGGDTVPDDYDANTENGFSTSTSYTLSSTSDVDTFLTRFQRSNGYKDTTTSTTLKLGNKITISDGTYNTEWYVAGFDVEHNQTAADGTVYDNGYGIALIPVTYVRSGSMHSTSKVPYSYISTDAHRSTIPEIITNLQVILRDHIVYRNVLLGNAINELVQIVYRTSGYTWTNCYGTLMSAGQMIGTFASNFNKYDDGEANYKLPLFDNTAPYNGARCWLRGCCFNNSAMIEYVFTMEQSTATIGSASADMAYQYRPLIYIR